MRKNRWLILIAGIIIQSILGGIYAWSVFTPKLIETYELSKGQSSTIFGLCIAVFTISMIAGGRMLSALGPQCTAFLGGVLFAAGYLVASASNGNYLLLLLGISVLSGCGIGFGYVCPLTVGMQWFPKHKGLITGVAVAGFGGGAVVLSSVASYFLDHRSMGVLTFFMWIALVAGGLLVLSALVLDVPAHTKQTVVTKSITKDLFSLPFFICLFGIFTGTFAGLLIVGNLTPIVRGAGHSKELAAVAVSVFAVGNALGRILWGFLFDRIRYAAIPASLGSFGIMMLLLVFVMDHVAGIMVCAGLLGFGFGANFVVYASALSSHFDLASFPRLYPICFLGYGLAGVIGPGVGGFIADATGSYNTALHLSIGMIAVATVVTALSRKVFATTQIQDEEPLVDVTDSGNNP